MLWAMLQRGSTPWRFIRAEPPCWKGEIRLSLHWWNLTIGWERNR